MTTPPSDLIDTWSASLVPMEGETETQRRVRAVAAFGPGYERSQTGAQRVAALRSMRSKGNHQLELDLFERDLLDYARAPTRLRAQYLMWSLHTVRFTFGDKQARQHWREVAGRAKRRIDPVHRICRRWNLALEGDPAQYFWESGVSNG